MRLKAQKVRDGLHPSEVVVAVETDAGAERLVIPKRSFSDSTLEIGYPISDESGRYLVELPQETSSGAWRVWVSKDLVTS
jgi:hypothetical protein